MKQQLTKELLAQLKQQGYKTLIAKGAPEENNGTFTQILLASKQEMHKEETAEATWQFSIDDDSFIDDPKMKYLIDIEK